MTADKASASVGAIFSEGRNAMTYVHPGARPSDGPAVNPTPAI